MNKFVSMARSKANCKNINKHTWQVIGYLCSLYYSSACEKLKTSKIKSEEKSVIFLQ